MRVLLLNNIFYKKGGSEAVFFNTAKLLKRHGHEVIFFSIKRDENIACEQSIYFPELGGKTNQLISYFWNVDAAKQLEKLIIDKKPDIAHVHLLWGLISPSIFNVLHRHHIPLIHTVHDYRMICPAYTFKNNAGEICEKCGGGHFIHCIKGRCSKGNIIMSMVMSTEMYIRNRMFHPVDNIAGFVFVSNFAKEKHLQYDKKFLNANFTTLYNYTSPILPPSIDKKDYILYSGRLSYEKGIITLLETVAQHTEIKLRIVGTGPLEKRLKTQYNTKQYSNIEFVGYKTGHELFELVRDAKYVCVPSEWYENNPMTIIEAYSLGTPVIGAKVGGIPEIVSEGKSGFLFEPGDTQSLWKKLYQALTISDEEYRELCTYSYMLYQNIFSAEKHYQKLIDFYNQILNKSKTPAH